MRALLCTRLDGPEHLEIVERPDPVPGPGQALVRMRLAALNFFDTLIVAGRYQVKPALPFSPGGEGVGVVEALGPGASGVAVGDRVIVHAGHGCCAELIALDAARLTPVPDAVPDEQAAGLTITYGTSLHALANRARLQPGEWLAVLGASGGVGLAAVELGRLMGARVIACARGAEKLEIARHAGADHVIDSGSDDLREVVKSLGGADVVYDPVGGDLFTAAFRACKPEARILLIGFASGKLPEVKPNHMLVKNIDLMGFYWGGYLKFRPEVITESLAQLVAWHGEGRIKPHISHLLPLARAEEGLDLLRSRRSTGKVVITI